MQTETQPVPKPHTMPPVEDRTAADLRSRLSAANWSTDIQLCYALRTWQQASNLAPHTAAALLGVPHVTSDTFVRLREFRHPIGAHHWAELNAMQIEQEVKRRMQSLAAPAAPAAAPAVVSGAPDLTAIATAILAELNKHGSRNRKKTVRTAELIADACTYYAAQRNPASGGMTARRNKPGAYTLARQLAESQKLGAAKQVDVDVLAARWWDRIRVYAPLLVTTAARKTAAAATAAVAATTAAARPAAIRLSERELEIRDFIRRGKSNEEICEGLRMRPSTLTVHLRNMRIKLGVASTRALWDLWASPAPAQPSASAAPAPGVIIGRPKLLSDGSLEVTTAIKIRAGHPLWDEALRAVNA